jgi:hypothetical protein
MNKSVFISLTYEDLRECRRKAWEVLRSFAADVRGMEKFGARKEAPLETCLAEVDQCNIFVGIIGFRLGSIDCESGKSFTQWEYERAYKYNKDVRIYLMDDSTAIVPARFVDRDERHIKLEDFKHLLRDRHTVATFVSVDDLDKKLDKDLRSLLSSRESGVTGHQEDFAESADTISKFLLFPAQYSGKQVRVVVKVLSEPFPASGDICEAFQLPFGRTVGVRVSLQNPNGFEHSGLDELYARGEQGAQLMVPVDSSLDVFADLQFADMQIHRVAARFKSESGTRASMSTLPLMSTQLGFQPYHYDADAKVAMLFSQVVDKPTHSGPKNGALGTP